MPPDGSVIALEGAPSQAVSELSPVVTAEQVTPADGEPRNRSMAALGFWFWDADMVTYGFIFVRVAGDRPLASQPPQPRRVVGAGAGAAG